MSSRSQFVSGVLFTAVSKYANLIVSLLVTAVLSRLMLPEQFGVVAIATVVISFLAIFADIGLTSTIIQFKSLSKEDLNKLFSMSFYLAVILSTVVFLGARYLADFYSQPMLKPICEILSIHLFFTTIAVVPNAIFYREKLFKQIAIRSTIVQVFGGLLAIAWAFYLGDIYALLVNPIVSSILIFLISYARFPLRFQFFFSLKSVAHTFQYSIYQFLFNLINFFSRNADTLIVGKHLGSVALGYYDKAYRLMSLPLQNITQVITPVLHPLLSGRVDDRTYLMKANESMARLLSLIGFPMSIWLYFVSDELILLFFGDQWGASVSAFQFLSLTVGIQLLLSSSGSFFQAGGDTRSLFICGLFSGVLNVGGIVIGAFYFRSIEAVAFGLLITFSINFIQAYCLMYYKVFKTSSWRFFKIILRPIVFSAFLGLGYWVVLSYLNVDNVFLSFGWKTAFYAISMAVMVFFGGYKTEIVSLLKRKKITED